MKKFYTYKNKEKLTEDDVKENPLDLLKETSIFKNGVEERDFFEVEQKKGKFELGVNIGVKGLFNAGIEYLKEKTINKINLVKTNDSGNYAAIGSSGDYAQIGSSGNYAAIGSSGDYAKIGSSGDCAQIGSSGDCAQIGSSGNSAKIGLSGNYAKICSSGDSATIGSSGNSATIGSSGYYAKICSSGNYATIGSSGNYAKICSSGDSAQIGSSGDCAQIELNGLYSIGVSAGDKSIIKGKNGNWITLSEWEEKGGIYIPKMVKTAQIGNSEYLDYKGNILKEDVFYQLINKEFVPVIVVDGFRMIKISSKKVNDYKVFKTQYVDDFIKNNKEFEYVAEKDGLTAHGEDIKQAIKDVEFKRLSGLDIEKHASRIKKQGYMTANDYRLITGACQYGTNRWLEQNGFNWEDKKTVQEVLKLTKGEYGNEKFEEFVKKYFK